MLRRRAVARCEPFERRGAEEESVDVRLGAASAARLLEVLVDAMVTGVYAGESGSASSATFPKMRAMAAADGADAAMLAKKRSFCAAR